MPKCYGWVPLASASGTQRARKWARALVVLVAVGCGERFYAATPSGGEAGAAPDEPAPGDGAEASGTTSRGGSSLADASGSAGAGGAPGGGRPNGGGAAVAGAGGVLPPGGAAGAAAAVPGEGLELWLDALVGVTWNDGGVSEWKDRSAHGRDAVQDEPSRQPSFDALALQGKPSIVFDGEDDALEVPALPGDFTAGVTLFAVGRTDANDHCMAYFEASNGSEVDDLHLGFYEARYLYEVSDAYLEAPFDQVLRTPELVVGWQRKNGDVQVRRNGAVLGESKFELPVLEPRRLVYVGETEYGGCTSLDGRVSELLVYSRALSPTEVGKVEAYLQQKWACCSE